MSMLVNPTLSTLLDNQLANLSYLFRDSMRVSGEYFKLPQSVPNDRKIDYQFRHFHAVFYTAFLMELSFRLSDTTYTMPHFVDILDLAKLKTLYKPGDFHLPKNISAAGIQNITTQNFPTALHSKMFGSLVNTSSYGDIADLLEHEIKTGQLPKAQLEQYKLWAHHFRRVLNPEQYLEKYITPQVGVAQAKLLQNQLKNFDTLSGKVASALEPATAKDALAFLKKHHPKSALVRMQASMFEKAFAGGSSWWWDLPKAIFQQGPSRALKEFQYIGKMAQDPLMKAARRQPSVAVETLFEALQNHLKDPSVKATTPFLRRVANMKSAKDLAQILEGSSLFKDIFKHGIKKAIKVVQDGKSLNSADEIMRALRHDVLMPIARKELGHTAQMTHLLDDLLLRKLNLVKLDKVFKSGNFWVKMPINMIMQFLGYGLISNLIDNKILQPYQRKIVKERGDSTEFLVPGYVGAVPGMLTFVGLMNLPFVQRLGYVSSFVLSGLTGMAVYAGTTMSLFYARLSRPRKEKPAVNATAARSLTGPRLTFSQQVPQNPQWANQSAHIPGQRQFWS